MENKKTNIITNLEKVGVQELNNKDLVEVGGGGWLKDAWDATVNALQDAYDWCKDTLGIKIGTDAVDYAKHP